MEYTSSSTSPVSALRRWAGHAAYWIFCILIPLIAIAVDHDTEASLMWGMDLAISPRYFVGAICVLAFLAATRIALRKERKPITLKYLTVGNGFAIGAAILYCLALSPFTILGMMATPYMMVVRLFIGVFLLSPVYVLAGASVQGVQLRRRTARQPSGMPHLVVWLLGVGVALVVYHSFLERMYERFS